MATSTATKIATRRPKGYEHRRTLHRTLTVQIEDDDPEFRSGPIPEEERSGRKKRTSTAENKSKKKGSGKKANRGEVLEPEINPLVDLLGLGDNPLFKANDDIVETPKGSGKPTNSTQKQPILRPPAIPNTDDSATEPETEEEERPRVLDGRTAQSAIQVTAGDESVTEPETDEDITQVAKPRNVIPVEVQAHSRASQTKPKPLSNLPIRAAAVTITDDDDATEPETEEDENVPLINAPYTQETPVDVEIDYEDQTEFRADYMPKPTFPPQRGVVNIPLILDSKTQLHVPSAINRFLRSYQQEGIKFFFERYNQRMGGILGDDMGLGKTIQVISFLSAIMQKRGDLRDEKRREKWCRDLTLRGVKKEDWPKPNAKWPTCLIVAPSSLLDNWVRELHTWGYFEVGKYVGDSEARQNVLNDFKWGRLDVVVTSLSTARINIDKLNGLDWSVIFVDEVHLIKSAKSRTTQAMQTFNCQIRFGLTGTAIQNNYMEMWQLLDWSNPGKVDTASEWHSTVVTPLLVGQSRSADAEQRQRGRLVADGLVKTLLPKYFLRRTKDLIANQMPKKYDHVVFCPLTSLQVQVYKRFLAAQEVQDLLHARDKCDCGSKRARSKCCHPVPPGTAFKYIHILIKISNHVMLLYPDPESEDAETLARNKELAKIAFPGQNDRMFLLSQLDRRLCGKWEALEQLLNAWYDQGGNKVLIFSKSVKLLKLIEWYFQYEGSKKYSFLHGGTRPQDRMAMVDQFNNDPEQFVFVISVMTGGVGLNLTSANKVVIFDPSWNPAHDLQAMDRAYRFGQTRDVHVYRLLGAGSIEELIYARQLYKQQQMKIGYEASLQTRYFRGIQGDKSNPGELFGMKNIFKLHENELTTKTTIESAKYDEDVWKESLAAGWDGVGDGKFAEFLLDDDVKGIPLKQENSVVLDPAMRILQSHGVQYMHENNAILQESKTEHLAIEVKKKRSMKRKTRVVVDEETEDGGKPGKPWPPIRKRARKE